MSAPPPGSRFERRSTAPSIGAAAARRRFVSLAPGRAPDTITPLVGGYSCTNLLIQRGGDRSVLRLFPGDASAAARELAAMRLAEASGLPVPRILAVDLSSSGPPAALLEYIDGPDLAHLLSQGAASEALLEQLGDLVAQLHRCRLPAAGTLGPGGQIEGALEDFPADSLGYLLRLLEGRAGERLGDMARGAIAELAEASWGVVRRTWSGAVLTHCDLNPKNVLAGPWGLVLIDWTFAMAAHPACDIGNFLRFEEDYPSGGVAAFLAGYGLCPAEAAPLRWAGRLLDLIAMLQFLEGEDDTPLRFATARWVVGRTLQEASSRGLLPRP